MTTTTRRRTMRAVVQHGYGPPEEVLRLVQVPRPEVGPRDVRVRVRATSVNTPDWVAVTGIPRVLRLRFGLRGPAAPVRGSDVAGVVEAVGSEVTDLAPGDEVLGSAWDGTPTSRAGTFAEYAIAPATTLIRKPPELSFADAAASVMSGVTALLAVRDVAAVGPGTRVLVNGASGGVGTFAVQIAAALGGEVTGVCSGRNAELVRALGARRVIDHTRQDFTTGDRRYDVVFDNVMNHPPTRTARVLAPGGLFIPNSLGTTDGTFGALPRFARAALMRLGRTRVAFVTADMRREHLEAVTALLTSGELTPVIDRTYPLAETARAVAHMAGHHARGNVVITA